MVVAPRVKRSAIVGLTKANGSRIVDLERGPGGLFDIVTIKNTGVDARVWSLFFNLPSANIRTKAESLHARIQDLEYSGVKRNFDVVLTQEERANGWFFNDFDTPAEAVARTRAFGARTAVVKHFRASNGNGMSPTSG